MEIFLVQNVTLGEYLKFFMAQKTFALVVRQLKKIGNHCDLVEFQLLPFRLFPFQQVRLSEVVAGQDRSIQCKKQILLFDPIEK